LHVENCIEDLRRVWKSLETSIQLEILVFEQGAVSDSFQKYGEEGFSVRHFVSNEMNASLARNFGFFHAKGEIVLFLDDDVVIKNSNFLSNHLRHYDDPSIPGVYGQVLEVGQAAVYQPRADLIGTDWGWHLLSANYANQCRTRNGGSGNLSVRKDWAVAVGGMDAWFEKGARREETDFNLRFTKRFGLLVFDPEASLIHLSAGVGGSRTWGHVRWTVPMHHIVGHWYFLLRAMSDRTLGRQGVIRELRHIAIALLKNPQVGINPLILLQNFGRSVWGLGIALSRMARGPRRIDTVDHTIYREIKIEKAAE
jgi:glycosyltransferase involved in cell wall biosynthesis